MSLNEIHAIQDIIPGATYDATHDAADIATYHAADRTGMNAVWNYSDLDADISNVLESTLRWIINNELK